MAQKLSKLKAPQNYDPPLRRIMIGTPLQILDLRIKGGGGGESGRVCGTHGKEKCVYYFDGKVCRKERTVE